MKGIFSVGGFRFGGLAALVAGVALLLAPEARARGGNPAIRSDLALGPAGEGSGAEGEMTLKQGKRGDRLKIRLRNLEPKTKYEIVDGGTDQILRTTRTNRRGDAKTSIRSAPPSRRGRHAASSLPPTLEGVDLEIRRVGEDEPVLEGEIPGDGDENSTWYKTGTVSSDPDAAIQVSVTMFSWHEAGMGAPYDSICLSVSNGGYWIAEDGGDPATGGGFGSGDNGVAYPDVWPLPDMPDLTPIPGPVTFWIRHGNELVQVASVEAEGCYVPLPEPLDNLSPSNGLPDRDLFPVEDGGDGGWSGGGDFPCPSYYFWSADSTSEEGLPLGVESVEALQGREFEVRDGEGNVLLSGELPHMEKIDLEPTPLPEPVPDPTWPCPIEELLNGIQIDVTIDVSITIDFGGGISWTFPGSGNGG